MNKTEILKSKIIIYFIFSFYSILGFSTNFHYIYNFNNEKNSIPNGIYYF